MFQPDTSGRKSQRDRLFCIVIAAIGAASAFDPTLAQDVPGIEICTVEKTMERRTSCLQSNVDFLTKTLGRLRSDYDQKLDAANRQIDALKASVAATQKAVADLQAATKKSDAKDAPAETKR